MGVALAAIADDRDLLGLDQVEVGIPVVIDAHVISFLSGAVAARPAEPIQKSGRF